jgi:hypothetical protein
MSNRIWTIVLAIALIGSFFLPFLKSGIIEVSGYDYVFKSVTSKGNWEKYVWLIIPVAAILLLIGALLNGNYFLGRSFLAWLPLLVVIFIIIRLYMDADARGASISITNFIKIFGTGFWATFVCSLLLAFVNPRRR